MTEYSQIIGLSKNLVGDSIIAKPTAGGINFLTIPVAIAGATAVGLGLKSLFSSNDPERMSTEKNQEVKREFEQNRPTNVNKSMFQHELEQNRPTNVNKSMFQRAKDWGSDTGYLVKCVLQDWFSEQSPECAAFRQRAKNDGGIYSKIANLSWWAKGLLIGGVSLAVVIPMIKIAFDRYARTGNMTVVTPQIKPDIKPDIRPEIKPEIKPEFKNEIKPEIKPQINPNFNLDYEPGYDPDYNPNLLQNYVPTINVNTTKERPQIVIQPRGAVFVPYEPGEKYSHKIKGPYDWLFEQD